MRIFNLLFNLNHRGLQVEKTIKRSAVTGCVREGVPMATSASSCMVPTRIQNNELKVWSVSSGLTQKKGAWLLWPVHV